MKCPQCQTAVIGGAKFCIECGHKLEARCPRCGQLSTAAAKFCKECGLPTSAPTPRELTFDEKLGKIRRYLPEGLAEKILSQKNKIEGQRRLVTVMFCDMEGFTPLVDQLGPEEAYSVMDRVYEILICRVRDYEGTVNEMTGDGIMALFGAPLALEDGPQRAIRAAHSIHREMVNLSDRLKLEKAPGPIRMRIGLHTGPVVVGSLGLDLRVEFKAVGDTVNLASRMQSMAEPGATYVTEDTFKLTEGFFRFEALGEKPVKGKEKPLRVYRVIGASPRRTRFDVNAERGLSPFVGREREVELLLDGYERAKAGRGQAFSIISEAGGGKSRVLYEFRKRVANEEATFLEGRCLSYGRGEAYRPIVDILKANFDIQEADEDSSVTDKVKQGLKFLGVDEFPALPYLLELLTVRDSGVDQILISPEGKKIQIIEALKKIAIKGSEIRPLIMAIEDLHWIDKSSEELLKYMLDSIPGAKVMLIFTHRPEFLPPWGARSFHNQLNLNRLSDRESLAMITYLLGSGEVDKDLEELILEKTEGVPFFIEEFIKSIQDMKIIERKGTRNYLVKGQKALSIPSTIQDVIMARVDLLPEGAKEVLQTGAVIEREFTYELVKEVMHLPDQELLSHLSVLKDSELLYERGVFPQSNFLFKHSLTREVVYDSILTKKRKKIHEQIGRSLEKLCGDKIDEHYGLLAAHFIASENYEKGAEYSKKAARKSQKAGAYKEAIAHSQQRVLCLERLPAGEESLRGTIEARTALAGYFLGLNQHIEAHEAVAPIVQAAIDLGDQRNLSGIYTVLGSYYGYVKEDYPTGVRYLEEGNRISRATGNFFYDWLSSYFLGALLYWYGGELDKGLEYFRRSLGLSEAVRSPSSVAFVKGTMSSSIFIFRGRLEEAYRESKEAVFLAEESGDIHTMGMAYACHGSASYFRGFFEEAEKAFSRAIESCRKTGQKNWEAWSTGWLGLMYLDVGKYPRSLEYLQNTISIGAHERYFPSWYNMNKLCLERARVLNQDRDINLAELPARYLENNRMKIIEGTIARYIGEIFLNVDDRHLDEADGWVRKSLELDLKNSTLWSLAGDYALRAELLKRRGDLPGSRESLGKALEVFRECGADGWVSKYENELAGLG